MKISFQAYVPTDDYRRRLSEAAIKAEKTLDAVLAMARTTPAFEFRKVEIDTAEVTHVLPAPASYSPIMTVVIVNGGQSIGLLSDASSVKAVIQEFK